MISKFQLWAILDTGLGTKPRTSTERTTGNAQCKANSLRQILIELTLKLLTKLRTRERP
jgi:hypothetical protein